MRKTRNLETDCKLMIDINELSAMLSCGKATARRVGEEARARMKIGRRVLYSVKKIESYIEDKSGKQE